MIFPEDVTTIRKGIEKAQSREWSKKYFSEGQCETLKGQTDKAQNHCSRVASFLDGLKQAYTKYGVD